MRTKISDVARLAGVSPSSVSRVIHNNGYVAHEKRKIIEKALKESNYHADFAARSLKTNKTGLIGHVIGDSYTNPFYANVAYGVDMRSDELGFNVLTVTTYCDEKRCERQIETLISRRVDGIVITDRVSTKTINKLRELSIPFVLVERVNNIDNVDIVYADNFGGAISAIELFSKLNHKNIGFIGSDSEGMVDEDRYNGFLRGLELYGIPCESNFIKIGKDHSPEGGYKFIKEIFGSKRRPTAIFVASDLLVSGVLQGLYDLKINVPEDVSIIGFDDTLSKYMSPKLTTVVQPMREMGYEAINVVAEKIRREGMGNFKTVLLETHLEIRKSVMAI